MDLNDSILDVCIINHVSQNLIRMSSAIRILLNLVSAKQNNIFGSGHPTDHNVFASFAIFLKTTVFFPSSFLKLQNLQCFFDIITDIIKV